MVSNNHFYLTIIFLCAQLDGFTYSSPIIILNRSMGTLTGTFTQSQSGPGSNGNEGVFHYPLISPEVSLSDIVSVRPRRPSRVVVVGDLFFCSLF